MIRGKERLAVIAYAGRAVLEQAEHDLVGMRPGGIAHFAEQRGIHADVVILHSRAGDVHGGLVEVVHHRIAVLLDVLEGAVAGPFAEFGELSDPAIGVARRTAHGWTACPTGTARTKAHPEIHAGSPHAGPTQGNSSLLPFDISS